MTTTKSKGKTTGNVSHIDMDITSPVPMKGTKVTFNNLTVLCGANGSGKTFILVCTWAISTIAQSRILAPVDHAAMLAQIQFIFDHCLDDQNIDGRISMLFDSGCEVNILFDKGRVSDVGFSGFEDLDTPTSTTFMSKNIRTFEAIKMYLCTRRAFKPTPGMISPAEQEKMILELSKIYKLYDIMYIEGLIVRMPVALPVLLTETLKELGFKEDIISIGLDESKPDFYAELKDGSRKYLSTYSAGEQSMLNMSIANC